MKEQIVTPRAGRGKPGQGRAEQKPAARRPKTASAGRARTGASSWHTALAYLPLFFKLALAIALGIAVFAAYRSAASASFFAVKSVDVEGAQRASRDEIRETVRQMSRAGVWKADLDVIANQVRELPWVRDVVVSRVLPSGLRVRVTEREPRVIARTAAGRLVWVDDDGVMLGAATPDEEDFFVRGLEEGRGEPTLRGNRARVAIALDLAERWKRDGLMRRVSEINLSDLSDVRVQLAGDDAGVEVRLGKDELAKRFRQALDVLDAQRDTPRGPFITYINVSQGKRAVIGTGATAHTLGADGAASPDSAAQAGGAQPSDAVAPTANASRAATTTNAATPRTTATRNTAKREEKREEKKAKKRPEAEPRQADVSLRPRRVG